MVTPLDGGIPETAFGAQLDGYRVHMVECDDDTNLAYFAAESLQEDSIVAYQGDLSSRQLSVMDSSRWGAHVAAVDDSHSHAILVDGYTMGDTVLKHLAKGTNEMRLLYGTPIDERGDGQVFSL